MTWRRILLAAAAIALVWLVVVGLQLASVAGELNQARTAAEQAQSAAQEPDLEAAVAALTDAQNLFGSAESRLRGAALRPLFVVPGVGRNLNALAHLAAAGADTARGGTVLADALTKIPGGPAGLAPAANALPLDAYEQLRGPLGNADALLAQAVAHLDAANSERVVDRIAGPRRELTATVPPLANAVHRAAALLDVLPRFLGSDGPRRYLFVAQNPAEARGTGGFIGAYSIVTIADGRFRFERFGEIQDLPSYNASEILAPSLEYARRYNRHGGAGFWHNINMTPDFPTAGRAMVDLYAKGTGDSVDGVIAADPYALQALLAVAGPVRVPGFGSVGADEVVDVISNRAHAELENSAQRKRLLGAVAIGAFKGFLAGGDRGDPFETARALATAASGGHLQLRAEDPDVEAAFLAAGVAGQLQDPPGDFLAVIANAGSAAKLDYYIRRRLTYDVRLAQDGSMETRTSVEFANDAPSSGISTRVIGPNAAGLQAGEHRLIVSLYGPRGSILEAFHRTAGTRPVEADRELNHPVYSTVTEVGSGQSQSLTFARRQDLGWQRVDGVGRYRLTIQGQTTLTPTEVSVSVVLPGGMHVLSLSPGLVDNGDGRVTYEGVIDGTQSFDIRFSQLQWWD